MSRINSDDNKNKWIKLKIDFFYFVMENEFWFLRENNKINRLKFLMLVTEDIYIPVTELFQPDVGEPEPPPKPSEPG